MYVGKLDPRGCRTISFEGIEIRPWARQADTQFAGYYCDAESVNPSLECVLATLIDRTMQFR